MRTERTHDSSHIPTSSGHGIRPTTTPPSAAALQETASASLDEMNENLRAELEEAIGQLDFTVITFGQNIPQNAASARRLGRNLRRLPAQEIQGRAERLMLALEQNQGPSRAETATRHAALNSLVTLYGAMDQRVTNAPLGEEGLPSMEGVSWDAESPLAGSTMDLPPFGERDNWRHQLAVIQPRRRPTPTPNPIETPTPEVPHELPPLVVDTSSVHLEDSEGGLLRNGWNTIASVGVEMASTTIGLVALSPLAILAEGGLTVLGAGLNILELADTWVNADNSHRAGAQVLAVRLALRRLQRPHGLANDGRASTSEIRRHIFADASALTEYHGARGGAVSARSTVVAEGFDEGLDAISQALDRTLQDRTRQLDEAGITDPVRRQHELDAAWVTAIQLLGDELRPQMARVQRSIQGN